MLMRNGFVFGICTVLLLVLFSFGSGSAPVGGVSWTCVPADVEVASSDQALFDQFDEGKVTANFFSEVLSAVSITCEEDTPEFIADDGFVDFYAELSDVAAGDVVYLNLFFTDSSGARRLIGVQKQLSLTQSGTAAIFYTYLLNNVVGDGAYMFNLTNSTGDQILTKEFTFLSFDYGCSASGFSCCPDSMTCLTPTPPGEYSCISGDCCAGGCVGNVDGQISIRVVPSCVDENLQECDKVIGNVYDYTPHGFVNGTKPVVEIQYRDVGINCFNKTNVIIAVHDDNLTDMNKSYWKTYESNVTKLYGDYYKIAAQIDYYGYVSVIKSKNCVTTDCPVPGFSTVPFNGIVDVFDDIEQRVCRITRGCDASADSVCSRFCPEGVDPDCEGITCTSQKNDCCNPENDGTCDLDCAEGVDPDCFISASGMSGCYPSQCAECSSTDATASDKVCNIKCAPGIDPDCNVRGRTQNYDSFILCLPASKGGTKGVRDWGELCDGNDLNNKTCEDFGFAGGSLTCLLWCRFKISGCSTCKSNNVVDSVNEECDGTDMGTYAGKDCTSLGYYSGTLTCGVNCKIDTSGCTMYNPNTSW